MPHNDTSSQLSIREEDSSSRHVPGTTIVGCSPSVQLYDAMYSTSPISAGVVVADVSGSVMVSSTFLWFTVSQMSRSGGRSEAWIVLFRGPGGGYAGVAPRPRPRPRPLPRYPRLVWEELGIMLLLGLMVCSLCSTHAIIYLYD